MIEGITQKGVNVAEDKKKFKTTFGINLGFVHLEFEKVFAASHILLDVLAYLIRRKISLIDSVLRTFSIFPGLR